ncbi:MAG TPA: TonB-dependent receptor plug domain-containing protein, partial [Chloroflexota bacterium]
MRRLIYLSVLSVNFARLAIAGADAGATYQFDLTEQPLGEALKSIGQQAGTNVLFDPRTVQNRTAQPLHAKLTTKQAIDRLLQGTDLVAKQTDPDTLLVEPRQHSAEVRATVQTDPAQGGRKEGKSNSSDTFRLAQVDQTSPRPQKIVQAQDASSQKVQLEEIVVTAQKREEKLHDVPMGITAITSRELQTQRLLDFEDLESKVPGLSVELSFPGFARLTIRGENVGGNGSTVATYLDDVPFGSSSTFAQGQYATGDFDTWDLQRVEVLRGPQGTLYGASSEGGLLKYVTTPPELNRFASAFELGAQNVAHGDTGPSYKAMLNLPVG